VTAYDSVDLYTTKSKTGVFLTLVLSAALAVAGFIFLGQAIVDLAPLAIAFLTVWTGLTTWIFVRSVRESRKPPYLYSRLDHNGFETALGRFSWDDVLKVTVMRPGGDSSDWVQVDLQPGSKPSPPPSADFLETPKAELRLMGRRSPTGYMTALVLPAPRGPWGAGNIEAFRRFYTNPPTA
jgi:hypothetical protein